MSFSKHSILQMAVKAVNDTVGPDELVPTLLVFGTFPRMSALDPPTATISQRATTIKRAMKEVKKLHAERQIKDGLHTRRIPRVAMLHDLALGSEVNV